MSEEERPVYRPAPWRTRPAPPTPDARRSHGRRASPHTTGHPGKITDTLDELTRCRIPWLCDRRRNHWTAGRDRVVFDGQQLDELVLTRATVHLENLGFGEAMLVIDRGPVHLHMQVQYPTVVESEGAERITVRNPPLPQENQ